MASGFFAILDDIAALMDDVAMTSKLATKKTAGILGDDLAVNAEKATGFLASREIPVLWAITKGSFINKLIILPVVFVLNWLYPPAINTIPNCVVLRHFEKQNEESFFRFTVKLNFSKKKTQEEILEEIARMRTRIHKAVIRNKIGILIGFGIDFVIDES